MGQKAKWEVVDHKGDVVFDATSIARDPAVAGGFTSAREWARRLAKDASDPEAPPLQARKVA